MRRKMILSLALAMSGAYCGAADELSPAQIEAEKHELSALLAKASPNNFQTNSPAGSRRDSDFSPYLTTEENDRLAKLLCDPEVSIIVTPEQALAAIKQREIDGSMPGGQYNSLMDFVNRRWPHDPTIIAFYREALASRGDAAIIELWSPQPGVWDDSLLEPVVSLVGKTTSWIVIDNALSVLNQHHAVWAGNASIPPRLSEPLLKMFPTLTNASLSGPYPGDQLWCNAARMLAETHDEAMLAVLRPFLTNKVMAGDGSYWMVADDPPLRACDEAALAIEELMEKVFTNGPVGMPGIPYWNVHASYPIWIEWDNNIAELQKRLDALPKQ